MCKTNCEIKTAITILFSIIFTLNLTTINGQNSTIQRVDTLDYYDLDKLRKVRRDNRIDLSLIKSSVVFSKDSIYCYDREGYRNVSYPAQPNDSRTIILGGLVFSELVSIRRFPPDSIIHIWMLNVEFTSTFTLHQNKVHSPRFEGVTFWKTPRFLSPSFEGNVDFNECNFKEKFEASYIPDDSEDDKRIPAFLVKDTLSFNGSYFQSGADFSNFVLPKYLSLEDVNADKVVDLSKSKVLSNDSNEKSYCTINIQGADLDIINFSYDKFRLAVPTVNDISTYENMTSVYEKVLNKFRINGQKNSYELLDKEFRKFQRTKNPNNSFLDRLLDTIKQAWNDYGYNKGRIWLWTGGFFLLFWLINWLRFPFVYEDAYKTPSLSTILENRDFDIEKAQSSILNFKMLDVSLYYTVIVFFGLKVESKNFNFQNFRGVSYIGLQYVVGLICLAYLANFVISSGTVGL